MTQEEKQILLQDLSMRLPYGVEILKANVIYPMTGISITLGYVELAVSERILIEEAKPYLRPMSSMNVVERKDLRRLTDAISIYNDGLEFESHDGYNDYIGYCFCSEIVDWLNEHHFDYRGLIEKGLAIEAPEGMYNLKNK